MNNKKILAGLLLATVGTTGLGFSASFADDSSSDTIQNTKKEFRMDGKGMFGKKGAKMNNLTDSEKEALESMNDDEKKEFFETKRSEIEAVREAHEVVIDKLIAGENLTDDEQEILEEIKEKRAERKVAREARKLEREELREIFEKKKAGEDLTEEEQTKLDEMKKNKGERGGKAQRGGINK